MTPPLTLAPSSTAALSDISLAKAYVGKSIYTLPVPAFVVDKSVVVANTKRLHSRINDKSITALLSKGGPAKPLLFRPHIKTLKSENVTRAALGYDIDANDVEGDDSPKYQSVVASTLAEIRGLWPLVVEGKVQDIIYGVPISRSHFPEFCVLRAQYLEHGCDISLFLDDAGQVEFFRDVEYLKHLEKRLETAQNVELVNKLPPWNIVMKIDAQENRAGTVVGSPEFYNVLKAVALSQKPSDEKLHSGGIGLLKVHLRGFYAHAGSSYDANGSEQVNTHLERELQAVISAAREARSVLEKEKNSAKEESSLSFLLSIGATPTAHAISLPAIEHLVGDLHANDSVELHAGNFVALDLQQVSTGMAPRENIAEFVVSEIVSYYEGRSKHSVSCCEGEDAEEEQKQPTTTRKPETNKMGGEYLLNAGVLALTREPPHGDPTKVSAARGLAQVKETPNWVVTRVSQEHGILEYLGPVGSDDNGSNNKGEKVNLRPWSPGDRVCLNSQHACITAAMHKLYFVVDGSDTVVDVWEPWKYW